MARAAVRGIDRTTGESGALRNARRRDPPGCPTGCGTWLSTAPRPRSRMVRASSWSSPPRPFRVAQGSGPVGDAAETARALRTSSPPGL